MNVEKIKDWIRITGMWLGPLVFIAIVFYHEKFRPGEINRIEKYKIVHAAELKGKVKNHFGSSGFSFLLFYSDSVTYELQASPELGGDMTSFRFLVERGDSIFKGPNCDSLFVFKNEKTYRFIITNQTP